MTSQWFLVDVLLAQAAVLGSALLAFIGHSVWLWWYRRWSASHIARARSVLIGVLARRAFSKPGTDRDPAECPLETGAPELETAAPELETGAPGAKLRLPSGLTKRQQIRLLADLTRNLDGEDRFQLRGLAEKQGLLNYASHRCRSRLWWRRLEGIRLLMSLRAGEQIVPGLFSDPHPLVRAAVAEWAADHPTPPVVVALLEMIESPDPMPRFVAQDSLARMGTAAVVPLVRYLGEHSGAVAAPGLRIAAYLADPRFLAPALIRCHDEAASVRALAAQLLGALGGEESTTMLTELLGDRESSVRAAAAQAVGRLGYWPATRQLHSMLRDRAWVVRRESALALRSLGAAGILVLRQALLDPDPFAADMARQVLGLPEIGEPAGTLRGARLKPKIETDAPAGRSQNKAVVS